MYPNNYLCNQWLSPLDHSHHRSKRNNGLKELTPGDRESCKPGAVGVLIINIIISMKKYRI
jgi:hypothetical protein